MTDHEWELLEERWAWHATQAGGDSCYAESVAIMDALTDVPALMEEVRRLRAVEEAARQYRDADRALYKAMCRPVGIRANGREHLHLKEAEAALFGLLDPPAPPHVAPEATQRAQEGR